MRRNGRRRQSVWLAHGRRLTVRYKQVRTDLNRCSVTVVGAWNLAIFTPQWVASKLGAGQAGPVLRMGFLPAGVFTRFQLQSAALTLAPGSLQVQPAADNDAAWGACETVALTVMDLLPETPVQALGINVGLDLDDTPEVRAVLEVRDLRALSELGGATEAVTVSRRVRLDGHVVNVSLSRTDGVIRLDANHHFEVSSAHAAAETLKGTVARARTLSFRIARTAYGAKELVP